MYQITLANTEARKWWEYVVFCHGLLIIVTDYGGGKNVFGAFTTVNVVPLWVMVFYDSVVIGILFYASMYHLDGMCEFAGFTGEAWAFFLLCTEPLLALMIPNVTFPWQQQNTTKKEE